MLITKEQQEALVDKYIKEKHNQDECVGFIDGLDAILELITMKQKLIKLSNTHYIIVDDSEIKVGYVFNSKGISQREEMSGYSDDYINRYWQKITHSTPIGGLSAMLKAGVKELSLSKVEEAIYEHFIGDKSSIDELKKAFKRGFTEGVCFGTSPTGYKYLTGEEYIQSLFSKTEWDIEFVDGKIKLI